MRLRPHGELSRRTKNTQTPHLGEPCSFHLLSLPVLGRATAGLIYFCQQGELLRLQIRSVAQSCPTLRPHACLNNQDPLPPTAHRAATATLKAKVSGTFPNWLIPLNSEYVGENDA